MFPPGAVLRREKPASRYEASGRGGCKAALPFVVSDALFWQSLAQSELDPIRIPALASLWNR